MTDSSIIPTQFRVASWNVNNRNFRETHRTFLARVDTDLLALQEVSPSFYEALVRTELFNWSEFSLSLRPSLTGDGRSRRLGCAVFGKGPFQQHSAELLDGVMFPERALIVKVKSLFDLTICSFHAPPGSSWGSIKPETMQTIAQWLKTQRGHTIFGMDANTPKTDHPVIEQNEWWWKGEPELLGHAPIHGLRDCYRIFLEERPMLLQEIVRQRPSGPLAVSHIRGNGRTMTECRYDFIYVSPEIRVLDVRYLYEEAVGAGSDHALVSALLEISGT